MLGHLREIEEWGSGEGKEEGTRRHYPSLDDAESRLEEAIKAKDPAAFGQALHSYQDYFAHTLGGFTFSAGGTLEDIAANCPECFDIYSEDQLREQAILFGHDGVDWVDDYGAQDWRAIQMREGSQYWILRFLLEFYDIDYDQFMKDNGQLVGDSYVCHSCSFIE